MGDGMRMIKIAAVVMGVLILFGTAGLLVAMVMRRPATTPLPATLSITLDEPAETRIVGISVVQDRLAVALQGGGTDRVVLVDPRTGAMTGRIVLRH